MVMAISLAASLFVPLVSSAQSMTAAQLQEQITTLLAQLQMLQQELGNAQGVSSTWCYTFNTNLSIGTSGSVVAALQTALQKDGESITLDGTFDDQTASAVTGFQEKYASEILAPSNLQYGTGYVGFATRTKLNALYGCGTTTTTFPPITPPIISMPIATATPSFFASQTSVDSGGTITFTWNVPTDGIFQNPSFTVNPCPSGITLYDVTNGQTFLCGDLGRMVSWSGSDTIRFTNSNTTAVQMYGQLDFGASQPLTQAVTVDAGAVSPQSPSSSIPSITMIFPTTGGGTLAVGQSIPYKVQVVTDKATGAFNLGLESSNIGWPGLTGNTIPLVGANGYSAVPDGGVYRGTATYTGSLAPGTYYLYVSWNSSDGSEPVYAYSNFFFNVGSSASSPQPTPTQSAVTILSPVGGITWSQGSVGTIQWQTAVAGQPADVGLNLLQDGNPVLGIGNVQNTGSYAWTIPNTLNTFNGSDFQIRVYGQGGYADSPVFSIATPTQYAPVALSGIGYITEYLYSNETSTINGFEFQVNNVTSNQLNVTITNTATGRSKTVLFTLSDPLMVFGHSMEITNIQQINTVTANGQSTYAEEARLIYQ